MLLVLLLLLTGLLVLVGGCLLGCWLIARSRGYALVGRGLALFSAKRAGHLSQVFGQAAVHCKERSFTYLLPWYLSDKEAESKKRRLAGVAIWRLFILAISLIVLFGELPISALRSTAVYTFLTQTLMHLPLDLIVGWLFMLVPGVYALWLGEIVGFIPAEAGLFPYRHTLIRWVSGIIASAFLAFSLFENYQLNAYAQCLLVQGCQANALVPVNVAAGFNLTLTLAGVISLWAVFYGLRAILALWFAFWYCVSLLLQHGFEFMSLSATDFQTTVLPPLNPYASDLRTRQELFLPYSPSAEAEDDRSNGSGSLKEKTYEN